MAGFAGIFTLAQLPPLVSAFTEDTQSSVSPCTGFVVSIVIGFVVAGLLWWFGKRDTTQVFRKETIAVAGLSWFLAGVLGAVPFLASGLLSNPIDAFFEAMSGLTTCGATVLGPPNMDIVDVAPSLLLWRALLQWIGGIGIVLVFVALLPAMGVTAKNLLSSESVGVATDSYQPRAIEKARHVATIYIGMTVLCTVLLVLIGGFGWFDAMCHAFTAMATGGYSTRSSIADFDSLGGELVLIVFMFFAGASLAVIATHFRTGYRCIGKLLQSAEFRIYTASVVLLISILTIALVGDGQPFASALVQWRQRLDLHRLRDGRLPGLANDRNVGVVHGDVRRRLFGLHRRWLQASSLACDLAIARLHAAPLRAPQEHRTHQTRQ